MKKKQGNFLCDRKNEGETEFPNSDHERIREAKINKQKENPGFCFVSIESMGAQGRYREIETKEREKKQNREEEEKEEEEEG